jgi:Flp pilus assembly protein TadG
MVGEARERGLTKKKRGREMKKFLIYYKEKKGMSLVLITLLLFVLLVFAATAVDISYMYNVKNQLQVAGDAAVLAGVKELAGGTDDATADLIQADARREAWKFACKNEAAKAPVYLETTGADCDTFPNINNLNPSNLPNGDIVVGHWEETPFTCNAPLRTGVTNPVNFCPANYTTGLSINAIQAFPRKTEGSPNGSAELFLGQVFRVIGRDWSFMSAQAEAIASYDFAGNAAITICFQTCDLTIDPLDPLILYLAPYPAEMDPGHGIAWTVFDEDSPSIPTNEVIEFFCDKAPDVCYQTVYSDNGSVNAIQRAFRCAFYNPLYDSERKTCLDGACDSPTDTVSEWRIIVPVFSDVEGEATPCPPGNQPVPKTVEDYAEITVSDVYASGGAATNCACAAYDAGPEPPGSPNAIVVTAVRCVSCDDLGDLGIGDPQLVK